MIADTTFIVTNGEGRVLRPHIDDEFEVLTSLLEIKETARRTQRPSIYYAVPLPFEAIEHIFVMADRGMSMVEVLRDLAIHMENNLEYPQYEK